MPQEAHLRCRLQESHGRFACAFAQCGLTKRSREHPFQALMMLLCSSRSRIGGYVYGHRGEDSVDLTVIVAFEAADDLLLLLPSVGGGPRARYALTRAEVRRTPLRWAYSTEKHKLL